MRRPRSSGKFIVFLITVMLVYQATPIFSQDASTLTSFEKALRNALIEICYGTRVSVDLNDPAKTEVSLEVAGLNAETTAALIADAAETDGSYVALSDLLIDYCLGEEVVTQLKPVSNDQSAIEVILIDAGIQDITNFFILIDEYVYFEEQTITYFESYSFTEEQYAAIFFTLEFGSSVELNELLVEYGVEESVVESYVDYAEETIDTIESEGPTDADEDGVLDIEDTDDDEDGVEDSEDTDDDGDGVEDEEQDDDADNDGVDDEEDTDDDEDGVEDAEDDDADGDGVDDDDADADGVEDEEDTDDDGDGVEDEEDTDDDGDGSEDSGDDSIVDDDGGVDDGSDE